MGGSSDDIVELLFSIIVLIMVTGSIISFIFEIVDLIN